MAPLVAGIVLSFVAAFCWGTGILLFKIGVKNTKPLAATFLRGLVAIPLLLILSITLYGFESLIIPFQSTNILWLLLGALVISIGDFFSLYSMRKIDVSIAQPITAIYPVFTTLTLIITNLEQVDLLIIIGTILNVLGVSIISFYSNNKTRKKKKQKRNTETSPDLIKIEEINVEGIVYALMAALFWGLAIVFTKILVDKPEIDVIPILGLRNGLMVIVAGIFVFTSLITRKKNIDETFVKRDMFFLTVGGVVTWVGGGVAFFTAVSLIGAARSTPISSISPFVVLLLSGIFLKEKIKKIQIFGVCFIVAGSILLSI